MTSVALTKVLFAKWWKQKVTFSAAEPDLKQMLEQHDAGLLIGDPALKVDPSCYVTFDLAEEWIRFTGKPFVFAFWAVRAEAVKELAPGENLAQIFQESRDRGLSPRNLDRIVAEWSTRLQLDAAEVRAYLTDNIYYELAPDCLEGLQLFYELAEQCGAIPSMPNLRFLDVPKPVYK
jgi:chorismate dehydratase